MTVTHDPDGRRDIAHVGPVELYTPVLAASRDFFVDRMGLREVHRDGDSVYLHTWDDYQSWTLRLVQRDRAGIGRTYLRAASPRAVDRLTAGITHDVVTDVRGLGDVRLFTDPDGHELGLYWDAEWYRADGSDRPALKNQAARYPGRGANLRRLEAIWYSLGNKTYDLVYTEDWTGSRGRWTREERAKGQAWGLRTIETFHTHGTPTVEGPA